MEWIFAHMSDPDFNEPFTPPGSKAQSGGDTAVSEEGLMMLESMGFPRDKATKALKATVSVLPLLGWTAGRFALSPHRLWVLPVFRTTMLSARWTGC